VFSIEIQYGFVNSFKIKATLIGPPVDAAVAAVDAEAGPELPLAPAAPLLLIDVEPAGVDADELVVVPLLPQAVSASSPAATAVPQTRLVGGRRLWNAAQLDICYPLSYRSAI